jgi:autotransporter-associated beta strand protein
MKPRKQTPFLAVSITLVGFAFTSFSTHAATLTWDTTAGDGAVIAAGSGDWNLTAGNTIWNSAGTNVAWSQTSTTDGSNAAIFAGTDGTLDQYVVTLGAQMAAESLAFNSSGYQIDGSPVAVITIAATGAGTGTNGLITVAAGKTATINSQIVYNDNRAATITANGTLNLGGGATNSQYNFGGAGTINMTAGTYTANIGTVGVSTFNQTGGNFNMTPGANNAAYNIFNNTRNVNYTISGTGILALNASNASTGTALNIGNNTAGSFTSTLTVNGGTVNVGTITSRQGLIRISNTATSNGKLDIQSGNLTVGTGNATNLITLFENGASATYSATMTQSGGTVTANGIQFGGTAGTYDAASSATLTLSGGELYVGAAGITRGTAAATLPTTIQLQGGTLGASQAWTSSLDMKLGNTGGGTTIRAQNSGTTARNITLSGILSNDGAVNGTLTKTGAGTLTLSGANSFTGGLKIVNGTVNATTNDSALGAGTVTMGGAGSTGATLTTGRIHSNAFTVNAPDSGSVVIAANGGGGNYTLSGGITLNGDLTIQTFNNAISGTTKAGGTITGGITGTGNVILNNIGLAANTFSLTTTAINHTGSLTLQGTGTGYTTISASIGANVTSVTQNSATSRLIISGINTYTGATNVNAGIFAVNGSLGNTSTTVGSGGTLQGSGSIVGSVTVQSGGTIAAGNSIESLATGALTLVGGSTFQYETNKDAAATVAGDLTAVTGNLTVDLSNSAILTLSELGTVGSWSVGDKLTLISYSGVWNGGLFYYLSGTLADDSTISFSGIDWSFNYNDNASGTNYTSDLTGSNYVTMTAIPEPSVTALLGGLVMLTIKRRRK